MTQPRPVHRETIPESYDLPYPLGRHIHHDIRSIDYPFATPAQVAITTIVKTSWPVRIEILDQLQVGSCTGEAGTYALGTDDVDGPGLHAITAEDGTVIVLNQEYAYRVYHNNTVIDGFPGTWEIDGSGEDTGSSGLATAQTLRSWKLVTSYRHCRTLDELLAAVMRGPVLFGSNWYDSMFDPDADGVVSIAARSQIAGGHEYLIVGVDPVAEEVECINSWGPGWGLAGRFKLSYATLRRLLDEDGDAIVLNVVRVPAPNPDPTPDVPPWLIKLEALLGEIWDWFKAHLGQTR